MNGYLALGLLYVYSLIVFYCCSSNGEAIYLAILVTIIH